MLGISILNVQCRLSCQLWMRPLVHSLSPSQGWSCWEKGWEACRIVWSEYIWVICSSLFPLGSPTFHKTPTARQFLWSVFFLRRWRKWLPCCCVKAEFIECQGIKRQHPHPSLFCYFFPLPFLFLFIFPGLFAFFLWLFLIVFSSFTFYSFFCFCHCCLPLSVPPLVLLGCQSLFPARSLFPHLFSLALYICPSRHYNLLLLTHSVLLLQYLSLSRSLSTGPLLSSRNSLTPDPLKHGGLISAGA